MLGPKRPEVLIFQKVKLWWETLHKIHLPEERKKYTDRDLLDMSKSMQEIEIVVRNLELQNETPLGKMVDFQKLRKVFHKKTGYFFGDPILDEEIK